jgi:antitoxin component HigA of HigAB toxin-antitoxin module
MERDAAPGWLAYGDRLDVLTTLIQAYEAEHHRID